MARIRSIKPDFFFDEELFALGDTLRLFFIGLWTQADGKGRMEYRPEKIKAQIFPYQEFNAIEALEKLSKKFITIYEVRGDKYIQINTFLEHQRITGKEAETPSKFPDVPKKHRGNIRETPGNHQDAQERSSRKGKEGKGKDDVFFSPSAPNNGNGTIPERIEKTFLEKQGAVYSLSVEDSFLLAGVIESFGAAVVMACWELWWMGGEAWSKWAESQGHSIKEFCGPRGIRAIAELKDRVKTKAKKYEVPV